MHFFSYIFTFSLVYFTGFSGRHCDVDIDDCIPSPCYFGGKCHDELNGFSCECKDGFLGYGCEAVVRQCKFIHPCGDNAVCVERETGKILFKCIQEINIVMEINFNIFNQEVITYFLQRYVLL